MQKLLKAGAVFAILASAYVAVLAVNAIKQNRYIGSGMTAANTISVSGTGEVSATPDIAQFSFTVSQENKDVTQAQKAAADQANAAIKFLKDNGIDEKDIKTLGFNVSPRYEFTPVGQVSGAMPYPVPEGKRTEAGVEVSETIEVKVRDTSKAGALVAGITNLGIKNISGVNFTIDDPDALQRAARTKAIDDAKQKAQELAHDLSVHLVRVVSFSENGGPYPVYAQAMFKSADSASAPVAPELPAGQNQITSQVTITYEIR